MKIWPSLALAANLSAHLPPEIQGDRFLLQARQAVDPQEFAAA